MFDCEYSTVVCYCIISKSLICLNVIYNHCGYYWHVIQFLYCFRDDIVINWSTRTAMIIYPSNSARSIIQWFCVVDNSMLGNLREWSSIYLACRYVFDQWQTLQVVKYLLQSASNSHRQKTFLSGQTGWVRVLTLCHTLMDTPVADFSAPRVNATRRVAYRPPIAISPFHLALSVFSCKQRLWHWCELWPYVRMRSLGTRLH